jgi:hypothetical protein
LFRLDILGWLLLKTPAAGDKGARTDLYPTLSFIANVSSLAFAMSANAAEDIDTSYSPENHGRGYKQLLKRIIFQRLLVC